MERIINEIDRLMALNDWGINDGVVETAYKTCLEDMRQYIRRLQHEDMKLSKCNLANDVYEGTYDCDDDSSWINFDGWLLSTSKVGKKVKVVVINED